MTAASHRHVLMLSGGQGSYAAGKRLASRGIAPEMLFTDTLIESADTYRFLIEGAADVAGVPLPAVAPLGPLLNSIPPLRLMGERKPHLAALAAAACRVVPGLHWERDGRTPFELFRDVRFLGNTRRAKCSHALKQDVARAWLGANCVPGNATIYVGIHWSEGERFHGSPGRPGARQLWLPWPCEAPLCEEPFLPADVGLSEMRKAGIEPPALYALGFPHNNCSGGCVKAGQKQFARLLRHSPEDFDYFRDGEEDVRRHLGKDVAILRDRRDGVTKPFPLRVLQETLRAGCPVDETDAGAGCGCFVSADDLPEA
jgi:hypothetical protein